MSQLQSLEGPIALAFIAIHCRRHYLYPAGSGCLDHDAPCNSSRMLFRNGWIQLALAVVTLCLVRAADLYGTLGCECGDIIRDVQLTRSP